MPWIDQHKLTTPTSARVITDLVGDRGSESRNDVSAGVLRVPKPKRGFESISLSDARDRAERPNASLPRPFLKWAGSKRHVLRHIVDLLPPTFRVYREPFLGSGALFFLLAPKRAALTDSCSDLIDTFTALRDNAGAVIRYLEPLKPDPGLFYGIRQRRSHGRVKRAAEFIYLNKTCWNGLYRVNGQGVFNVPYGAPKTDFVADPANLRACSDALRRSGVDLASCDFEKALANASAGDLVYLDPPYVTGHSNNGFLEYNETIFSWADQVRLAGIARRLREKGAHVIVSNANHSPVVALYKGFSVKTFDRSSTLASDVTKRRTVSEVLIHSAP